MCHLLQTGFLAHGSPWLPAGISVLEVDSVMVRQDNPHCPPRGRSGGAEELVNNENKKKETPQHVYFLCLSVMSLILHLPVENLPRNSVANGSRPPFFQAL